MNQEKIPSKNKKTLSRLKVCGLLVGFLASGCTATLCTKGDTKQGVYFDFWYGYVDISGLATSTANSSWVKKIFTSSESFLLASAQKTVHCDNFKEMKKAAKQKKPSPGCKGHKIVENVTVYRYTEEKGYEEWPNLPKSQWSKIKGIDHKFKTLPKYHYENCRFKIFGGISQLFETILKI